MDKNLKQIIPMDCPVCEHFYFSELDDVRIEQLGLTPNTTQCRECGWYYDLEQVADPDLKNQANEMSLNEYREWYKKKIKEDPEWEYYLEVAGEPEPHSCPVCGEYTFSRGLSNDICPVCGWQDTGFEDVPDEQPGMSMMSFNDRVAWFKEKRAKNPKFRWEDGLKERIKD